jgi:endoglucanase
LDFFQVLADLSGAAGPSGSEEEATARAAAWLRPLVDSVEIDRMGNLLGRRACGKPGARLFMLDAHLDEIGLIVTGREKGYLRFQTLGGIDPRMLPGREITLLTDPPSGAVVTCLPPHVQEAGDADRAWPISELLLDAGLSEDRAASLAPPGTRGVFTAEIFPLGDRQLSGRALDDRACFAVLLRTMELLRGRALPVDVAVCGSVQEEVGLRGAGTAAFALAPDACVVVDVTHGATPDAPKHRVFKVGGGPCVGRGPGCHRGMAARLAELARALDIPHQIEVMEGRTGTNAWSVQTSGRGVATAMLSVPLKYMHSPVETLDRVDLENTAQLLAAYVLSPEEGA